MAKFLSFSLVKPNLRMLVTDLSFSALESGFKNTRMRVDGALNFLLSVERRAFVTFHFFLPALFLFFPSSLSPSGIQSPLHNFISDCHRNASMHFLLVYTSKFRT